MKRYFLLADSQPLFSRPAFVRAALTDTGSKSPSAAYLGASNGDKPEFFEIFVAAMERYDVKRTAHVTPDSSQADREFLASADLIFLAGGDALSGMQGMESSGLLDLVRQRNATGAVLMGLSAGAMLLGSTLLCDNGDSHPGLGWLPHVVDVHDEKRDWSRLKAYLAAHPQARGLAIATGAAAIVSNTDVVPHGQVRSIEAQR